MKRQWTPEELEADFTLHADELDLIGDSKADRNLLGFAVLLKYFQYAGRFPTQKQEIPCLYSDLIDSAPLGRASLGEQNDKGRFARAHPADL